MFEKLVLERTSARIERALLGFFRQSINPMLGFDASPDVFRIEIESDRIFNYIDSTQWSWHTLQRDLLESAEFVTGKYFFGGTFFLNYSSQMDMVKDPEKLDVEQLHHRLGFELNPFRYLYFNLDYEIGGLPDILDTPNLNNDGRYNIKLKVPLKKIQDMFFKKKKGKK
jgi:hypothetical protein